MKGEKIRLQSLRGIERSKLRNAVRMVNATNDLIYAGAVIVNDIVGVQRTKKLYKQTILVEKKVGTSSY